MFVFKPNGTLLFLAVLISKMSSFSTSPSSLCLVSLKIDDKMETVQKYTFALTSLCVCCLCCCYSWCCWCHNVTMQKIKIPSGLNLASSRPPSETKLSHFYLTSPGIVARSLRVSFFNRNSDYIQSCNIMVTKHGAKIQQASGPHEDLLTMVKRCKLQRYGHWAYLPFIRSGQNHFCKAR